MKRGEIWWVEFKAAIGSEIQKTRPAVIVSNDAANHNLSRVVVIPVTSSTGRLYPGEAMITVNGVRRSAQYRHLTLFSGVMEIHTLELPKLPAETDDENLLLYWLRLFKAQRLEEYEMLATKDPSIKKTVDILKQLSADDKARLAYEAREKAIRDELAKMHGAYSKGQQETRLEIAQKLLAYGIALEIIAESSGLSIDEVQALSKA
jgi:hypothetical protein